MLVSIKMLNTTFFFFKSATGLSAKLLPVCPQAPKGHISISCLHNDYHTVQVLDLYLVYTG